MYHSSPILNIFFLMCWCVSGVVSLMYAIPLFGIEVQSLIAGMPLVVTIVRVMAGVAGVMTLLGFAKHLRGCGCTGKCNCCN